MELKAYSNNIVLEIAYEGTQFLGWQKTMMGSSIEGTLQFVIEQILQHPVTLQAASRTDAGVHAKGQIVNFFTPKQLNFDQFKKSLNALLPKSIIVLNVFKAPASFHPTLSSAGKEYRYYVCNGVTQLPWHQNFSWHTYYPLDLEKMKKASLLLLGTHDFGSFCNVKKNETYTNTVRTLSSIEISSLEEMRLCFKIIGTSFLYKMVRNIVGTLVYIGRGKLTLCDLSKLLKTTDRTQAGITAPSCGLFLTKVFYDEESFR